MSYQSMQIDWNGIEITIRYDADYFPSSDIGHIEVCCDRDLPITETGYKSIFINRSDIADIKVAAALIRGNLEKAAKQTNWQAHTQLALF